MATQQRLVRCSWSVCPRLTHRLLGDVVSASDPTAPHHTILHVRRRFQFSSSLKRMSTICSLPNGKNVIAVKGAPETIKGMLESVPHHYDETFQRFTRRGSRVLALGYRETDSMSTDQSANMLKGRESPTSPGLIYQVSGREVCVRHFPANSNQAKASHKTIREIPVKDLSVSK